MNKKNYVNRFLPFIVSLALLFGCNGIGEVLKVSAESEENAKEKITDALMDEMLSGEEDLHRVIIWSFDTDLEEVQRQALSENERLYSTLSDPTNEEALENLQENGTDEEIQTYIERKRELSRATYEAYNSQRIDELVPKGTEILFMSRYAPVFVALLTNDEIFAVAEDPCVEMLDLDIIEEMESADFANTAISTIRADYNRDTLGLKGSGVKIGQYEDWLPRTTISGLNNSNIVTISGYADYSDYHASLVAALLVGKTATNLNSGCVPQATLYSYGARTSPDPMDPSPVNFSMDAQKLESLLNYGVNIINCSRCIGTTTCTYYDSMCKWLDHVAIQHDAHFVLAAGNVPEGGNPVNKVSGGGFSYNAIVVGNMDDQNTSNISDDIWNSTSCYSTATGLPNKPDLSAPGTGISNPWTTTPPLPSGTSFSAPLVTGAIAQLCTAVPSMKTKQDTVKAICIAGVHDSISSKRWHPGQSDYKKCGAGILDARGIRWMAASGRYATSYFTPSNPAGTTRTYTFAVSSSDTRIRVALSYLKRATHGSDPTAVNGAYFYNLDLKVSGPVETKQSLSTVNNTEIIDFEAPAPGTYTITITLKHNIASNVHYAVAWR